MAMDSSATDKQITAGASEPPEHFESLSPYIAASAPFGGGVADDSVGAESAPQWRCLRVA
jgi:hypothetical protein